MNGSRVREALAAYLDDTARSRTRSRSLFNHTGPGPLGVDTLHTLAAYVRGLDGADPRLVALAGAHAYLYEDGPHHVFVPRTPDGRAMIDGIGLIRTGTATEFLASFVAVETSQVVLHAA